MRSDYNIVSPAERLANGVVQSVNVVLAVAGCVALGVLVGTQADPMQLAALAVYWAGLLAMVGPRRYTPGAEAAAATCCTATSTMPRFS